MKYSLDYNKILTDDSLMETVEHGTHDYPFQFYLDHLEQFDFHCIEWHWHVEFEFVYVEQGPLTCWVGQDCFTLATGEGVFINSAVLHRFYAESGGIMPNFLCTPGFLSPEESSIYDVYVEPVISSKLEYIRITGQEVWHRDALKRMQQIIALHTSEHEDRLMVSARLQQLWSVLWKNCFCHLETEKEQNKNSAKARLQIMMQFIQANFKNSIALEQIAASVGVSKSTATNLFRKQLHTTPVSYLIHLRLQNGAKLLLSTEKNVGVIAAECGFESEDHFCKSFKKYYGYTPTAYRRRKLKDSTK